MAYNDFIPITDEQSKLEKEVLDIIEVNSYSKNILAAYNARKIANNVCKEQYGKANYKEYVEMLMLKYFPEEHEKSELGKQFIFWLYLTISFVTVAVISWLWWVADNRYYSFFYKIFCLLLYLIPSALLFWFVFFKTYKKLKALYQ